MLCYGICQLRSPLVLVAKEAHINLVVLPLKDFCRPVAKSFHLGPHQVMAGALQR